MQEDGVLILSCETSRHVIKWWISINNPLITKHFEQRSMSWEVVFNPSTTESQRSELVIDFGQKGFCFRVSKGNLRDFEFSHVVAAIWSVVNVSFTSDRAKSFNSE